ncbi:MULTISPECIES: hypothetical protein [unclassified Rhizobium]|uniref:hypothetical protein n=1 Tax=unclassified Rhizobium TaxID=2613769 RepID=UPI00288A53AA|nr:MULTISPECIES: hypothetical protein [unclassified Rhizobium]
MTGNNYGNWDNVDLDASYDYDSVIDVEFDLSSEVFVTLDVEKDICVDVNIDGNEASFAIDVQAYGDNTSVDLNLVVAVQEGEWSSITATGYAAAT